MSDRGALAVAGCILIVAFLFTVTLRAFDDESSRRVKCVDRGGTFVVAKNGYLCVDSGAVLEWSSP